MKRPLDIQMNPPPQVSPRRSGLSRSRAAQAARSGNILRNRLSPRPRISPGVATAAPAAAPGAAASASPLATAALLAGGFVLGTQIGNAIYNAIDPGSPDFNDIISDWLRLPQGEAERPNRDGPQTAYPVPVLVPAGFTGGQCAVAYQFRVCNSNGCSPFWRNGGMGPLQFVGIVPDGGAFAYPRTIDSLGNVYQYAGDTQNWPNEFNPYIELRRGDLQPDSCGDPPPVEGLEDRPKGALVPGPLAGPPLTAPILPTGGWGDPPKIEPLEPPKTFAPPVLDAPPPLPPRPPIPPLLKPPPPRPPTVSPPPPPRPPGGGGGGGQSPPPTRSKKCDPCVAGVETKLDRGLKDLLKLLEDLLENDCCEDILARLAGEGTGSIDLAACGAETADLQSWGGTGLGGIYQALQVHTQAIDQLWNKLKCVPDEFPEPILAVSDQWGLSPGGDRPVIVIAYKEWKGSKWGQSTYASSIPWPKTETISEWFDQEINPLPREHGPFFATLALIDGSRIKAYGFSSVSVQAMLSYYVGQVKQEMLPENWSQKTVFGESSRINQTLYLLPRKLEYYSKGQSANVKPDKERFIDPPT